MRKRPIDRPVSSLNRFLRPVNFHFFVFLLSLAFAPRFALTQPSTLLQKKIIFDQITQKIGLTQASINCILQDREGYLWIGTWSGLVRYDGYTTTVYYSSRIPGKIKSNKITSLLEDSKGNLWVGTHMGGLFQYNRNDDTFIQYFHDPSNLQSISSNNVTAILDDKQGNIWVGTENGLNVFDGAQNNFKKFFTVTGDPSSISSNSISTLFLSSSNELWIGTNSGISRLISSGSTFSFERYITPGTTALDLRNFVFQIAEVDVNGKPQIWFCTMKGMGNLANGEMKSFTVPGRPLPYSYMRCILPVGGETPFIIAGSEMGLHFYDVNSGSFKKFLNRKSIS